MSTFLYIFKAEDDKDFDTLDARKEAMGIDWMLNRELVEAIPPAYTLFIGEKLISYLRSNENGN